MKMVEVHARSVGKEKHEKRQNLRSKHQDRLKQKTKLKAHGLTDISNLTALAEAFDKTRKQKTITNT
jgi:hypothetical protein